METYVVAILVAAAPFVLLPVALVWYINVAGIVAYFKDTVRVRKVTEVTAQA
jgi:hypothetical protein